MLSTSARLDSTIYGPDTLDEAQRRRSIYFTVKRSRLIPSLVIFDAPHTLQGIGRRPSMTVASQVLMLMNSPLAHEYANGFDQILKPLAKASRLDAIRVAYVMALARPLSAEEMADSRTFLQNHLDHLRDDKQQRCKKVRSRSRETSEIREHTSKKKAGTSPRTPKMSAYARIRMIDVDSRDLCRIVDEKTKSSANGFTLVELLVVIAIIAGSSVIAARTSSTSTPVPKQLETIIAGVARLP